MDDPLLNSNTHSYLEAWVTYNVYLFNANCFKMAAPRCLDKGNKTAEINLANE